MRRRVNLTFDPVVFEDPALGVKVHRGVYAAAQALYERFLPLVEEHLASSPYAKVVFTVRAPCSASRPGEQGRAAVRKPADVVASCPVRCRVPACPRPWPACGSRRRLLTRDSCHVQGHSLGGCLGALLMLMFVNRKVLPPLHVGPVYTFGSPAIFAEAEADASIFGSSQVRAARFLCVACPRAGLQLLESHVLPDEAVPARPAANAGKLSCPPISGWHSS